MKKKILFITRLHYPHIGGVETHLQNLITQLADDYQITTITSQHQTQLPLKEVREKETVYRIPNTNGNQKKTTWTWLWQHRTLLFQADIIHIHDVFWWILPMWPFIRKKIYITFHGYEGSEPPTAKQIFWHRLASWLTKGNICVGDFHQHWYGVKPTIVSYGAATPVQKSNNQVSKKQRFVYIGRLHSDTGILTYLKGLRLYQQYEKKFSCDVYGDGPLKEQAETYVKQHNLPVTFHGFTSDAAQKLRNATVAFVSRYLAIIEALQAKVAVIAHYNNQIKYDYLALAPFAQWITIASTPKQIAKQLASISQPPKTAVTWAKQQTWKKVAQQYQQLWKSTIQ